MIDLSATEPQPLADAVRALGDRTPVGSLLSSDEWSQMPLALRQRAQFSAKVESMRVLERIQQRLMESVREQRRQLDAGGQGAFNTRQNFINDVRSIMADEGIRSPDGKQRTLQDPTSVARLGLIWDQQTGQAYGYAGWKNGMDPDLLAAYPAQELVRVADRKKKRAWLSIWTSKGGKLFGGRMIALKTDPIWEAISEFGTPWPPFRFGSGMGLRDIGRRETEALGLLAPGERVKPNDLEFNERLQAQARLIQQDPDWKDWLETAFVDQVKIEGDTIKWAGGRTPLGDLLEIQVPAGALREEVQRAADTFDRLLRIPAGEERLTLLPVDDRTTDAKTLGEYLPDAVAPRIGIRDGQPDGGAQLAAAEEFGHFMDHHLLGTGETNAGWGSETNPALAPVRAAIEQSEIILKLRDWRDLYALDPVAHAKPLAGLDYLLSARESFARAVAQWVAEKSGNQAMREEISRHVFASGGQQGHWTIPDFAPISAALDQLFADRGWLTK